MTTIRAKSKKVSNITFPIGLSVIEAARQNVLATFPLKNTSKKLPLTASGSFFSPLAGSSSPVKVSSKRHTQVSPSVVSTISKSPKIFNNRPVNKLIFSALTTTTTSTITTASQMAAKAVTTAMMTLNSFVVPDEILEKIFTAAVSSFPDMNSNSNGTSHKIRKDQPQAVLSNVVLSGRSSPVIVAKQSITPDDLKDWADQMEMELTDPPPVSDTTNGGAWKNVNGHQRFSGWVASNLVSNSTFKIKMALLSSLFQLLPGCIGLKSVSQDAVKLFCVEFASQESLNGAIKVVIGDEVFLTTFKIVQSSGVASVFFPPISVALRNVPLGIFPDNIKAALGIFGVITSVKLKPAGLWQYAVVHFKDVSSTAEALKHWSVLVKKDSVRIFPVVNQRKVIASRDAFNAKLVNLLFGCTAFEISDLVSQFVVITFNSLEFLNNAVLKTGTLCGLDHLAVDCKVSPPLPPKSGPNSTGGSKVFKSSFVGAKSYAKAVAFVVSPAAGIDPVLGLPPKVVAPMAPGVSPVPIAVVEFRLASMEFHLNELALLVKSIIEPVGSLVVLVTKLLSTLPAVDMTLRESVVDLERQVKAVAVVASMLNRDIKSLTKKCD
ncbi:hypothetical protein G9A89_015637 [Geosiphon pyriformis]|nr:hypothetical protein G9A89_015637 [Geosiphon pyriformis]